MSSRFARPRRWLAGMPVSLGLIAVNIGVSAWIAAVDNRFPSTVDEVGFLVQWGANLQGLTFTGEPWRLATSMFLHGGVLHLALNMLALFELGSVVEPRLGSWRTLLLYLLSGVGASWASATWQAHTASVGASGALFGFLAVVVVFGFGRHGALRTPTGASISPWRALLLGGITLGLGAFFQFDNAAHIGGFVVGAVLSLMLRIAEPIGARPLRAVLSLGIFGLAAGLVLWLTTQAYQPQLAQQIRAARLLRSVDSGNTDLRAYFRTCAIEATEPDEMPIATAFHDCLNSRSDRFAAVGNLYDMEEPRRQISFNIRTVWPACQARAAALSRLALSAERRDLIDLIVSYCTARRDVENSLFGDATAPAAADGAPARAALRQHLLHFELVAQLANPGRAAFQGLRSNSDAFAKQGEVLAAWQAEISPEAKEVARLTECPFYSCKRSWAR